MKTSSEKSALFKYSSPPSSSTVSVKQTTTAKLQESIDQTEAPKSSAGASESQTAITNETSRVEKTENIAVDSHDGVSCATSSSRQEENQKADVSSAGSSVYGDISADASSRNIESAKTQSINILSGKIFEMTNNVFKTVLNSIPHSNEVKDNVQKAFEESMSATSRLIPNTLSAESASLPEAQTVPSTSSAARNSNPSSSTQSVSVLLYLTCSFHLPFSSI